MFLDKEYAKSAQSRLPEVSPVAPIAPVDPFSLESLIAWLEKQPAGCTYNYECTRGGCLLSLWLGGDYLHVLETIGQDRAFDLGVHIANGGGPYTFGAALLRARKATARLP